MTILALDMGGSKVAAALVAGGRVARRRQLATPPGADMEALLAVAEEAARPLLDSASRVAVASAGLVREGTLDAVNRAIFRLVAPFPLARLLQDRLGMPVALLNDGAAAAWGEYRHGAGRGAGSLIFMTISTGIGGGIVAGGRLLQGRQGLAGHLGFMAVEPDGKACGSGRSGTLESVAGGRALEEAASSAFGRPIGGAELFALDGRDERATAIIDAAARTTARALASLVSLIDPDRIVIGGGIGLATGYLARLRRGLEAEPALFRAPLVAAALGADAGLVGAASWVEEEDG